MKIIKLLIAAISIAIGAYFIPWLSAIAYLKPLPITVQAQVNDALNYRLDGIIVYVDKKGEAPQLYAAGWKNREHKIPANSHALFKIASISKLYIAAAAAKLINTKQLDLDKSLADYLPDLAGRIENAKQITLRMLLQHRSGIPNFIDNPKFPWANMPAIPREALAFALDMPADFAPDARYKYSNTNYLLIGEILDKALGYSHHQYIKQQILEPLNLTHTYSLATEVNLADMVSGYSIGYDGDLKMQNYVTPGGSMVATAEDVGVFLRALNDGRLLTPDEQKIYSSIYVYEHTGLLPGYSSIARYFKDIDTVVVQFVNTSGGNSWMISEIVYNRVVKILHKEK